MKKQLLIAGGSGLIGQAIKRMALQNGWACTLLSRNPGKDAIVWNPENGTIDIQSRMHFDAIINLAGSSLNDGRWTSARKKEIYDSRIKSCRTFENYLFDGRLQSNVYVGASAVGIYGDRGDKEVTERTPVKSNDWFTKTVNDWEREHRKIESLEIRTLIFRFGLVLSTEGGALTEILKSTRFGIIPSFGNGRQYWSWIHIDDLARMILFAIDRPDLNGIYLSTAPSPVPSKTLIKTLNSYLPIKRITVSVPRLILKVMLGEMHRVLFDSCNAKPEKILKSGFVFSFPSINEAAKDLLEKI